MSFQFNPDTHVYQIDGVTIPSVTQCLGILSDLENVPRHVLERAAERGSYVHGCAQLLDAGHLDESRIHREAAGYINGYKLWKGERKFIPITWGNPTWSEFEGLKYGLTFDVTGWIENSPVMVDLKCTSSVPRSLGPQLAAYVSGAPKPPSEEWYRIGVQLFPDGTYRQYDYESESDFDMWYAALYAAHWEPSKKLTARRKIKK